MSQHWLRSRTKQSAALPELRLDALLEDHASLLRAAARSLELLNELNGLSRQDSETQRERDDAIQAELTLLRERLDMLAADWKHQLIGREAESIEKAAALYSRLAFTASDWDVRFAALEARLNEEASFGAERLKVLAAQIRSHPADFGLRNPEAGLMAYLYSYLPALTALDIGANKGEIAERLLDAGYEVYAFEPNPVVFEELQARVRERQGAAYNLAVGSSDTAMKLHVAEDRSKDRIYEDPSQLSSLIAHSMPADLPFVSALDVTVRSLESLANEHAIPRDLGLVKIDTEGYDLEVIRGMGPLRPQVLLSEYWAEDFVFGQSGALNRLDELVREARARGYQWYIVLYRVAGSERISYYCNYDQTVSNSWGNVFFFQDRELFVRAMDWCAGVLPTTYFNGPATTSRDFRAHDVQPAALHSQNGLGSGAAPATRSFELEAKGALGTISAALEQLTKQMSMRNAEIALVREQIAGYGRSLSSIGSAMARLETRAPGPSPEAIIVSSTVVRSLQERIDGLNQVLADERFANEGLKRRLDRFKQSFSWKLTSPLREVRRIGQKIRDRLW
jgi:FkbM family methyltransferase